MTATHVNGTPVVADNEMPSPMGKGEWPTFRVLTLADGSTIFGCGRTPECTFTARHWNHVARHISATHKAAENALKKARRSDHVNGAGAVGDLTLSELLARAERLSEMDDFLDRIADDRDHWRQRALTAERRIHSINKALGPVVSR